MKQETYKIGDSVTYKGSVWRIEKEFDQHVFIRSGKLTAFVFKDNQNLKKVKE
jgi:hypothetical protein